MPFRKFYKVDGLQAGLLAALVVLMAGKALLVAKFSPDSGVSHAYQCVDANGDQQCDDPPED